MLLLDGSPELTRVVIKLAESFGTRPFTEADFMSELRSVARPGKEGVDRETFDRLFLQGLIRCGYLSSDPGSDGSLRLTERSISYHREFSAAEEAAFGRLLADAGIAHFGSEKVSSAPEPVQRNAGIFQVTRNLLASVLAESGIPDELIDTICQSYRDGRVYLSSDGEAYRFVL